jgi:hypothetical protein
MGGGASDHDRVQWHRQRDCRAHGVRCHAVTVAARGDFGMRRRVCDTGDGIFPRDYRMRITDDLAGRATAQARAFPDRFYTFLPH